MMTNAIPTCYAKRGSSADAAGACLAAFAAIPIGPANVRGLQTVPFMDRN